MAAPIEDLVMACVAGDAARVRDILSRASHLAEGATMFGVKPILAAHYSGRSEIVALLKDAGVVIDPFLAAELGDLTALQTELMLSPDFATAYDVGGSTALHGACYWGAIEAARMLIAAGANVRAQTRDGFLHIHPLGSAVATPNGDKALNVPNAADDESNVLTLVDLLLDAGADVNAQRRDGGTALHTAGYRGHLRVIRRLLERGADPTILAKWGEHSEETPADTARAQGQGEAAKLLDELQR